MRIKLKADRIRMYKIMNISALEYKDLPDEYLNSTPRMFMNEKYQTLTVIHIENEKEKSETIAIDGLISESDYGRLWIQIKLAGDRLHKINSKINTKKDSKVIEWSGTEYFNY